MLFLRRVQKQHNNTQSLLNSELLMRSCQQNRYDKMEYFKSSALKPVIRNSD